LKLVNGLGRRVLLRILGSLQDLLLSIVVHHVSADTEEEDCNENYSHD
jgi:hypothetical protein